MFSHPLNLAIRLILELSALVVLGYWGFTQYPQSVFALVLPFAALILWTVFKAEEPEFPKPIISIPGLSRIVLEISIFNAAVWSLFAINQYVLALIMGVSVFLHYAASYDRIVRLLHSP